MLLRLRIRSTELTKVNSELRCQFYKHSTIVNYESRVLINKKSIVWPIAETKHKILHTIILTISYLVFQTLNIVATTGFAFGHGSGTEVGFSSNDSTVMGWHPAASTVRRDTNK